MTSIAILTMLRQTRKSNGKFFVKYLLYFAKVRNFLLICFLASGLSGCGTRPVLHSFQFDNISNSGVKILDYRYGDSNEWYLRADPYNVKHETIRQSQHVGGYLPVGTTLYVKWKILDSGETLAETVDLREVLPKDMTGHKITFVINGRQLHVYLVTPAIRSGDQPIVGPGLYSPYVVIQIYPKS